MTTTFNQEIDQWPIAIVIYKTNPDTEVTLSINDGDIEISDSSGSLNISFSQKSIKQIVTEINSGLQDVKAENRLNIGSDSVLPSTLITDGIPSSLIEDNPYTIRFKGIISRPEETSIISLKPPRAKRGIEPWYARISRGKFGIRFNDTSFLNYPGINADAIYIFGVPEFANQEWSIKYGAPYKDVFGEVPFIQEYNPNIKATGITLRRSPIFYREKNISISINGVVQSNSIIKFVDENNGIVYLNQRIYKGTDISVDYSFKETDYEYDGVNLNVSTPHNPLAVDSYVSFYLKPIAADGALISGRRGVFHEITNTMAQASSKIAIPIKEIQASVIPIYEPVIYLGSIIGSQGAFYDDFSVIDTRSRGGGIKKELVEQVRSTWREAEFFFDVADFNGINVPGNAGVVINLDQSMIDDIDRDEIVERATKSVAVGVVPVIDFKEPEEPDLILKNSNLYVEFSQEGKSISLKKIKNLNDLSETTFLHRDIIEVYLESIATNNRVEAEKIFSAASSQFAIFSVLILDDFKNIEIKNKDGLMNIKWSGLLFNGIQYPSSYVEVNVELLENILTFHCSYNLSIDGFLTKGVEFPILKKETSATDSLVVGVYGGFTILNPGNNLNIRGPNEYYQYSPGFSLPIFADWNIISNNLCGLFPNDKDNRLKVSKAYKNDSSSYTKMFGIPSIGAELSGNFDLPFKYELHQYSGDWYKIAEKYRDINIGARDSIPRVTETGSLNYSNNLSGIDYRIFIAPVFDASEYLSDTGTLTYTGWPNFSLANEKVNELINYFELQDKKSIFYAYGWHSNVFGSNWPESSVLSGYLDFYTGVTSSSSGNLKFLPYTNHSFERTTLTATENNYRDYYGTDYDGKALGNILSPGNPEADHLVASAFAHLLKSPNYFSGVYIDQYAGTNPYEVYYPDNLQMGGNTTFVSDQLINRINFIRKSYKEYADDLLLASEIIDERFLNVFDFLGYTAGPVPGNFAENYAALFSAYPLPLWSSIYGDYSLKTPIIGPIILSQDQSDANDRILITQALRNMHFGILPSLSLFILTGFSDPFGLTGTNTGIHQLTKNLINKHEDIAPIAYYGRRLAPINPVDEITAVISPGWSILYGEVGLSLWENGNNSNVSLLVSNISKTDNRTGSYTIGYNDYNLSRYTGLYETIDQAYSYIGPVTGDFTYDFVCSPLQVRTFEFK